MGRRFTVEVTVSETSYGQVHFAGPIQRTIIISECQETVSRNLREELVYTLGKRARDAGREAAAILLGYVPVKPPPPNRWLEGRWAVRRSS